MTDSFSRRGAQDDSSDDDWRDPLLEHVPTKPSRTASIFDDTSTLVSDRNSSRGSVPIEPPKNGQPSANPDDYWVLPPNCTAMQILGPKRIRTGEIARATGVYLTYNNSLHQIDLWGDSMAIENAKRHLNLIAMRLVEDDPTPSRTTKKWSRPERELTEKEKRREEKRQQRVLEEKKYLHEPTEKQSYHSVYYIPEGSVSISRILGVNESYLNEIRVDCKTYIEFDPQYRIFRLSSGEKENLVTASARLRNWHLRVCRNPEGGIARLMQQPSGNLMLKYRKLPFDFVLYQYVSPNTENVLREKQRIFETISTGRMEKLEPDLISFKDVQHKNEDLSEIAKTLDERNEKVMEELLDPGLESLRLKDWDIRMKIRYGTICLVDFPKKDNENLTIEEVSEGMFKKSRFKSALAPCISKTRKNLDSLFDYLSGNGQEFSDNPKTSFVITADQYPTALPAEERRKKDRMRGDMWRTRMEVAFTERGERGLWSTVTRCTDLVDISCFNPERPYSWDLKLQYARSVPHEDINSPHEKFSHNLRLSPSGRLIIVPVVDFHPQIVTQKTKWKYFWNGFVVEICQEELWDLHRIKRDDKKLSLDFSDIEPHRVLFKVSMYRESWLYRLAENLRLRVGEAPSWTLREFLGTSEENISTLMHFAKKFGDILANEVPLYYIQSSNSLV